ncbi:Hsp90 protein-domain-containing protein [Syncephalis fuscata]|nr:Hsp90 protein-domain-containing protein [Syncephalis fuscata]
MIHNTLHSLSKRKILTVCGLTVVAATVILLLASTGTLVDAAKSKSAASTDDTVIPDVEINWTPDAATNNDADNGKSKPVKKTTKSNNKKKEEKPKKAKKQPAEQKTPPAEKKASDDTSVEQFAFQTEVSRMMKLIINSVYKSKEIFLRELISNASDALDKIRLLSLTDKTALESESEMKIVIRADRNARKIIITDTGVGMTHRELRDNLGTLAKSGTAEFVSALEQVNKDDSKKASKGKGKKVKASDTDAASASGLIGQFGVGFYSAFLVADRVTVASKHNTEDRQWLWSSSADDASFTISEDPRGNTLGRGTEITLHIKNDMVDEYLSEKRVRELVSKYSEFVNFPIYLHTFKTETIEDKKAKKNTSDANEEDEEDEDEDAVVEDKKEKPRTVERKVPSFELMNTQKPIWTRNPRSVNETEYAAFYRAFTKDEDDPLTYIHFKADAASVDFRSLIFIPKKPPTGYLNKLDDDDSLPNSVKLYVRHIFITDELRLLMPRYLTFIRALVDADDLPLNVSRETLQKTRALRQISKKLVQKTLAMITKLSEDDPKAFSAFLQQYGSNLKLGVIEDTVNRDKLLRLIRYHSTHSLSDVSFARTKSKGVREQEADQRKKRSVSLDDYISRMKKGQKRIYYISGISLAEMTRSPFLERLTAKNYEVLYMDEALDEYVLGNVAEYDGKRFTNVAKAGLVFDDEEDENLDPQASAIRAAVAQKTREREYEEFKPVTDWLRQVLEEHVIQVTISNRLTKSACALVAQDGGLHGNLERVMRAQALSQGNEQSAYQLDVGFRKILEINTQHPLIRAMAAQIKKKDSSGPKRFYTGDDFITTPKDEIAFLLFETTQLRSDYDIADRSAFASRVEDVMRRALDVDLNAQAEIDPEFVKPVPEKEKSAESKTDKKKNNNNKDEDEDDDEDEDNDNEDEENETETNDKKAEKVTNGKDKTSDEDDEDVSHDEL